MSPAAEAVVSRGPEFAAWSAAVRVESLPGTDTTFNTPFLDGCPSMSRDGREFYLASNRPGGRGKIDIWVSRRASENDPWGPPENPGPPINSPDDDFCPTLDRDGHRFFFVSDRAVWSGGSACGAADIYVTRFRDDGTAEEPINLGCSWNGGPNSAGAEAAPSPLPQSGTGLVLYFSSTRAGGFSAEAGGAVTGDQDIYMSVSRGGTYGPAQLVPGVNSAFEDGQPNVRRDGLEVFFFSNRPGTFGAADIYSSARNTTSEAWHTPTNLGALVNSAAADTRPSISWDGSILHFGSARPGGEGVSDIYRATRQKLTGNQ